MADGRERRAVHLQYRVARPQTGALRLRALLDARDVDADACVRANKLTNFNAPSEQHTNDIDFNHTLKYCGTCWVF